MKSEFLVIPKGTHTALVENPLGMNLRIELFLRDHFPANGDPARKNPGETVPDPSVRRAGGKSPARSERALRRRAEAAGRSAGKSEPRRLRGETKGKP